MSAQRLAAGVIGVAFFVDGLLFAAAVVAAAAARGIFVHFGGQADEPELAAFVLILIPLIVMEHGVMLMRGRFLSGAPAENIPPLPAAVLVCLLFLLPSLWAISVLGSALAAMRLYGPAVTGEAALVGMVVALYLPLRAARPPLVRSLRAFMTRFRLEPDGVTLELPIFDPTAIGTTWPRRRVRVRYDELTELRLAGSSWDPEVAQLDPGPWGRIPFIVFLANTITLIMRAMTPRIRVEGDPTHPTRLLWVTPFGQPLVLRGPDLFYVVTVDPADASRVIAAYERSRASSPAPPELPLAGTEADKPAALPDMSGSWTALAGVAALLAVGAAIVLAANLGHGGFATFTFARVRAEDASLAAAWWLLGLLGLSLAAGRMRTDRAPAEIAVTAGAAILGIVMGVRAELLLPVQPLLFGLFLLGASLACATGGGCL